VAVLGDDVAFTVITRKKEAAPITFEPSFRGVQSVKVGQALIKATFRGVSAYTCIDVMRDARMETGRSDCHDFLPPNFIEPIEEPVHLPIQNEAASMNH
jgi:hypothetical protein